MRNVAIIFMRELKGYFATPLALVFIVVFLATTGAFAFYVGNFFGRGRADLAAFFVYHPWLYLLLVPAISMRLWAEEAVCSVVSRCASNGVGEFQVTVSTVKLSDQFITANLDPKKSF